MALRNQTEAYDLSLFETRPLTVEVGGQTRAKPAQKQQRRNNIIELPQDQVEKNRRKALHPLRALAVAFTLGLMLTIVGSVVFNQVQLNELTTQIASAEQQLAEQQSVHTQLQMEANSSMTLSDVEKFVQDQLDMHKVGKNQVTYITLTEGDQGTVVRSAGEESWLDQIWSFLQGLVS